MKLRYVSVHAGSIYFIPNGYVQLGGDESPTAQAPSEGWAEADRARIISGWPTVFLDSRTGVQKKSSQTGASVTGCEGDGRLSTKPEPKR
jgi:hypothetical protein